MDMTYWIKALLRMFYIVTPSDCKTENDSSAFKEAVPFFVLFIILENVILYTRKRSFSRLNDSINSLSHGVFYGSGRILSRGLENWFYCIIYNNFKILDLQWNSTLTWYAAALFVDFCYYWVHRANHEIHVLWAQHQVHHSSEDFNLAVGLRQSILHSWCGFVIYLPLAVFIPPKQFILHQELNLLYQFWIHNEVVTHLGPLEYVFNTPNHHRVHHGSNLECLDKNYGGILIIWDRLFGTFATNTRDTITYGLIYQPNTFNPLYQQFFYNFKVLKKFQSYDNWTDKLQSVIKGPSWFPGSRWTGDEAFKEQIQYRIRYNPELQAWCKIYLSVQFVLTLKLFNDIVALSQYIYHWHTFILLCYILFSLTVIGMFFDKNPHAVKMEIIRCIMVYIYFNYFETNSYLWIINMKIIYGLSASFWVLSNLNNFLRDFTSYYIISENNKND